MTHAAPLPTESPPTESRPTGDSSKQVSAGAVLAWFAWVIGLALLWYVLGFASTLARENAPGAPEGATLALPLYPFGYGRLFVGALLASTIIGLLGRRAGRVLPAGVLAAGVAWGAARASLADSPQAQVFSNDLLILFATALLAVTTVVGLGIGIWGARGRWQLLVAISLVVTVVAGHVLGVISDLETAFTSQPSISADGSEISRWLILAALFSLAVVIAAWGKAHWLVLTAIWSVGLPLVVTVLVYLSQLIRPRVSGNVAEEIVAPIADLVTAVLSTASTWWPPLAVLAGGVVGLVVWQARRGQRGDVPVLAPAHPVTTGDPGGRTPRRGDHDD